MNSSRMTGWNTSIGAFLMLSLLFVLAGCGFHPRGDYGLPQKISPVLIKGEDRFSDIYRRVADVLTGSGIEVTREADAARTVLSINELRVNELVTAVDAKGKASEYELIRTVEFSLQDRISGAVLVSPRKVEAHRLFSQPGGSGLGTDTERLEIREQLGDEVANALVRTLGISLR